MCSYTGCICKTFLHCVFSNGPSIHSHKKMQSHTGCICLSSHHCVFSNVSSEHLHKRKHSCTGCICWASPHYESAYVFWQWLHAWMYSYTGSICGHPPWSQTRLWIFHFLVNIWMSIFHLYFAPLLLVSEWDKEKCLEREASVKVKVFSFPTNLFRKKKWFRSLTSWCIFQACSFLLVSLTTFYLFLLVFFFSLWATPLW